VSLVQKKLILWELVVNHAKRAVYSVPMIKLVKAVTLTIIIISKILLVNSALVKPILLDPPANLVQLVVSHVWFLIRIAQVVTLATIIIFLKLHVSSVSTELSRLEKPAKTANPPA
jgi:hypothetical protein